MMSLLPVAMFCWLLFGPLGLSAATWAVLSAANGEFLTAVISLGFSAFCFGLIIPLLKAVPRNIAPRGTVDPAGTTIRPDRGIDIPIQISLIGLVVATALFAVFAPLGMVNIPVPETMRLYFPLASGFAAVLGAPWVVRIFKRGSTSYLRLEPEGFEFVQGWRPKVGVWAEVKDVTDEVPDQPAPTPNSIVVIMSDGSARSMAAASFTPDGVALRKLVRFYWQHPDRRGELVDGRVLQRLERYVVS